MPAALSFTRERSLVPSRLTPGSTVAAVRICPPPRPGAERRSGALVPSGFVARWFAETLGDLFPRLSCQERFNQARTFRPLKNIL